MQTETIELGGLVEAKCSKYKAIYAAFMQESILPLYHISTSIQSNSNAHPKPQNMHLHLLPLLPSASLGPPSAYSKQHPFAVTQKTKSFLYSQFYFPTLNFQSGGKYDDTLRTSLRLPYHIPAASRDWLTTRCRR